MSVITYKCPHCGAPMKYDAQSQSFKCEFCGHHVEKDSISKDIDNEESTSIPQSETSEKSENRKAAPNLVEYHCPNCGAVLVADETTAATFCRYCGSPTIIKKNLDGEFKPKYVIPFKISKQQIQDIFKKWCRNGLFMPIGFHKNEQMEKITGTYVPFWLYDCDISMQLSADATKVRRWINGDTEYTNTKKYYVERSADISYKKIPADGSSHMDDGLMDALEPYDYSNILDFDMPYLSGFCAERFDQNANETFSRVDQRMLSAAKSSLDQTIAGYTSHTIKQESHRYIKQDASYALLPVWMLKYKYKDKIYTFAVNGQTGKVVGKPPVSAFKVLLSFVGIGVISFITLLLGGAFFL